jgi:hypothetical protein
MWLAVTFLVASGWRNRDGRMQTNLVEYSNGLLRDHLLARFFHFASDPHPASAYEHAAARVSGVDGYCHDVRRL